MSPFFGVIDNSPKLLILDRVIKALPRPGRAVDMNKSIIASSTLFFSYNQTLHFAEY